MNQPIYSASQEQPDSSDPQKLNQLISGTNQILYRCQSVFPFTLFPDTIIIDLNKIDIIYANFFFSKSVFTLMIEDVRTVKVDTGPFFARMQFEVIGYEKNPPPVNYLAKADALKARQIIIGLNAAKREDIDLTDLDKDTIMAKVEKIGLADEIPKGG